MQIKRDNLVLIIAFAAAIALHAVMLPWVGAAVGDSTKSSADLILHEFSAGSFYEAGDRPVIDHTWQVIGEYDSLFRFDSEVFLSTDRIIDQKDLRIDFIESCSFPADSQTNKGQYTTRQSLPVDADGPYWLI
ncbi:MAG: hypothetical protein AAF085_13990, partial [Planctomycetota bacterium]